MKYYIDKQKFVVYKQIPDVYRYTNKNEDLRLIVENPKEQKIYLDILEYNQETGWVKIRLYENKIHPTGETRLEVYEAYVMLKPENHFKIEGLHDVDLFDGRFNIQKDLSKTDK